MEPNDTQQLPQFSAYFHNPTATVAAATTGASTANGLMRPHNNNNNNNNNTNDDGGSGGLVYPHSVASSGVMSTMEPAKRKRGRPRKYGTPEQALAAKKTAAYSNSKEKRKQRELRLLDSGGSGSSYSGAWKKSQLGGFGNLGQGFTPHIISVAAGEDVGQKIMMFMQQSNREICILSASGSISNASLRQPATSGGNVTYEGRFEIISLSGSYVRTERGGRTGGLSVCLSNTDGQIIGGGVGGPLKAAGPVQAIVGTFQIGSKKEVSTGLKGDSSGSKFASPVVGASVSSVGFHSPVESYGRNPVRGNDDLLTIGGTHFMIQTCGPHVAPSQATEWRGSLDPRGPAGYDLTGGTGLGGNQSPENGDYD